MKKKVLSLLLVAAMGLSMLVGCGGNGGNDTQAGGTQTGEPEAITLKVWVPDNQISSGLIEAQQKAFAEANKDKWTITWETAAVGEDKIKDEVLRDVEAAADVFFYANDQIQEFVNAGAIARLGGETEKMVNDTIAPAVVDTVKVGGALYGIPFTHNTFFMFYDKTLLTEEDVKTMEGVVGKETGSDVINFNFQTDGGWKFGAWYYGAGLSVFGADGSDVAAGCDWNNATGLAVTNYLVELLNNPKVQANVNVAEKIAEHKLAAWWDGSWNAETYKEILGDDLGMTTIPTYKLGDTDVQLKGFYGSKAIGVNAKSKAPAAAVAFAAFLGSEEQQLARFEKSGQVPTNINAGNSDAVKNDVMSAVIVAEANNCSVAQPTAAAFSSKYWTPAGALGDAIIKKEVTAANAQQYIDDFVKALTAE